MTNFIDETLKEIAQIGKKEIDISWVGSKDGTLVMSWETFKKKFRNVCYDSGFGAQKIADDLVVVFCDSSWLERHEYDGAESWAYMKVPVIASHMHDYDVIDCDTADQIGWMSLAELNEEDDE